MALCVTRKFFVIMAVLVLSLSGCSPSEGPEDGAAITVGDRKITKSKLKEEIATIIFDMGITDQEAKSVIKLLIDKVIEKYLILEHGKEEGITLGNDELQAAVNEIREDYPEDVFKEILVEKYIDFNDWKDSLRQELLVKKIIEKNFADHLSPVKFDEIKAYYNSHRDEFKRSRMVQLRQVVTGSMAEAEKVKALLADGHDMEKLAGEYSITPEGENGGYMGWMEEGELPEDMFDIVFSLDPGEISDIIESPYGYHIFEVLSQKKAGFQGITEVMAEIESSLLLEKRESFYKKWVMELKDRFPVSIENQVYTNWNIEE